MTKNAEIRDADHMERKIQTLKTRLNKAKLAIAALVVLAIYALYRTQGWQGIIDKTASVVIFAGLTALGLNQLIDNMKNHDKNHKQPPEGKEEKKA